MDFYYRLAFNVLLQLLAERKEAKRFYPVLAKLYVRIHFLAQADEQLQAEIEHQEAKAGGRV